MKQQKSNILIRKQKKYNPNRGNQSGKGELTVFQFTIFQMEISTTDLTPNIFEMKEKKKKIKACHGHGHVEVKLGGEKPSPSTSLMRAGLRRGRRWRSGGDVGGGSHGYIPAGREGRRI